MKRSTSMNIALVLLTIQAVALIPLLADAIVSTKVSLISRIVCAILGASIFIATVGFWQMKKQGIYAYAIYMLLSQLYFFATLKTLNPGSFVFSLIVLGLGAKNKDQME